LFIRRSERVGRFFFPRQKRKPRSRYSPSLYPQATTRMPRTSLRIISATSMPLSRTSRASPRQTLPIESRRSRRAVMAEMHERSNGLNSRQRCPALSWPASMFIPEARRREIEQNTHQTNTVRILFDVRMS
jgi:hypothetical protein